MPSSQWPVSYEIKTFGCKVNAYDSGLLETRFHKAGLQRTKNKGSQPEVFVLNTCAVTAEATKEAVREIRRLKARSPLSKIVVTGCAAQVDKDKFEQLPSVDLVVANSHKSHLEPLLEQLMKGTLSQRVHHSNIFKKEDLESGGLLSSDHSRSFLKIQDGCNSFCTFCVIPFARGKSRSLEVSYLSAKVDELYDKGVREVVLTGVHIGDYEDGPNSLDDLVEAILLRTKMPRIRLGSLEPIEISDRLFELYQDPKLCSHFHISLQSAQSHILKGMKRNYGHKQVELALNKIAKKVPGSFVGMDIIAGFPGETVEQFEETYSRMRDLPWTRMHVFPYSPRSGTYAMRMPGHLHRSEIMTRAGQLRNLSAQRFSVETESQVGKQKSVLVLQDTGRGLSGDYWNVDLSQFHSLKTGDIISVAVTGFERNDYQGWLKATV
jgi:threonylcarbamoyladenosine tRNA methylthiotransferase MtaB